MKMDSGVQPKCRTTASVNIMIVYKICTLTEQRRLESLQMECAVQILLSIDLKHLSFIKFRIYNYLILKKKSIQYYSLFIGTKMHSLRGALFPQSFLILFAWISNDKLLLFIWNNYQIIWTNTCLPTQVSPFSLWYMLWQLKIK